MPRQITAEQQARREQGRWTADGTWLWIDQIESGFQWVLEVWRVRRQGKPSELGISILGPVEDYDSVVREAQRL